MKYRMKERTFFPKIVRNGKKITIRVVLRQMFIRVRDAGPKFAANEYRATIRGENVCVSAFIRPREWQWVGGTPTQVAGAGEWQKVETLTRPAFIAWLRRIGRKDRATAERAVAEVG